MSSRNRLRSLPVLADFQSAISKPTCFSRWLFSANILHMAKFANMALYTPERGVPSLTFLRQVDRPTVQREGLFRDDGVAVVHRHRLVR